MDPNDQVHRTLGIAAHLLAEAANQVRHTMLEEPSEHVKSIADALWRVREVQRAIGLHRPDLARLVDEDSAEKQELNRWRDANLPVVYDLAEGGNLTAAVEELLNYARRDPTPRGRRMALMEIARLTGVYAE